MPGFSGDGVFEVAGAVLPVQSLWVWGATAALLAAMFWFLKYTDAGPRGARLLDQPAGGAPDGRERRAAHARSSSPSPARTGALAGVVITPIVLANWDAGIAYGLKGFIGAILGNFRSPAIAVLGGPRHRRAWSRFAAGYVSSGYKDAIVYGVLLAYLLVRGGVFVFGRAALPRSR